MTKTLIVSKALVRATYQRKLVDLESLGCKVRACVPSSWIEEGQEHLLEISPSARHLIHPVVIRLNGRFHLHHYPGLAKEIERFEPDLVLIDEEPYNLATFLAARDATRLKIPAVFFTWQNLNHKLPLPFMLLQRYVFNRCRVAIAGTNAAQQVLRARGFNGNIVVTPQFGVDTEAFSPSSRPINRPFTVGYIGRLVHTKGVHLLIDAMAGVASKSWQLLIAGYGPDREALIDAAAKAGLGDRCRFDPAMRSTDVPKWIRRLDVAVLPSITAPRWKEQFGRTLVEAMACGVAVVGSDSGEIPSVVGDAGMIFPEEDVDALYDCLRKLADEPDLRRDLAERGRQRAIDRFSNIQIARQTNRAFKMALQEPQVSGSTG